VLCLFNFSC